MNKIEWTDRTWNPITGCTPISEGCKHCYAKKMAYRLAGRYGYPKRNPFQIAVHKDKLRLPLEWKTPANIFICSMGDLFHKNVSFETITDIYDVIGMCSQHFFIICTKRPERLDGLYEIDSSFYYGGGDYLENCIHLITAENQKRLDERMPALLEFKNSGGDGWKTGLSCEPLLEPMDISAYVHHLDWVIVGRENGAGARPFDKAWAINIYEQCNKHNIPFFWKDKTITEPEYKHYPAGAIMESEEAK